MYTLPPGGRGKLQNYKVHRTRTKVVRKRRGRKEGREGGGQASRHGRPCVLPIPDLHLTRRWKQQKPCVVNGIQQFWRRPLQCSHFISLLVVKLSRVEFSWVELRSRGYILSSPWLVAPWLVVGIRYVVNYAFLNVFFAMFVYNV